MLWELFESPDASSTSRFVSFVSTVVIGVSILIFCLETLPMFRHVKKGNSTTSANRTRTPQERQLALR